MGAHYVYIHVIGLLFNQRKPSKRKTSRLHGAANTEFGSSALHASVSHALEYM